MKTRAAPNTPPASSEPLAHLDGTLERFTFQSKENGYTVAKIIPQSGKRGGEQEVTVVGALAGVNIGELLHLEGIWTHHAQYGRQFEVRAYSVRVPATIEGIRKYLGSGLVKGVGPRTAEKIVEHFGLQTLDIIENAPQRLREVPKVGDKIAERIQTAWQDQKLIKEIMMFLQGHGVSTSLAVKIFKQYGGESIAVVRTRPYQLARDVYGIGFVTADKIARQMGIAVDDPARVQAGLLYALSSLSDEGHCFAERTQLVEQSSKLLEIWPTSCDAQIDILVRQGDLIAEVDAGLPAERTPIFLPPFFFAENGTASKLRKMQSAARSRLADFRTVDWPHAFEWLAGQLPITLTDQQRQAVQMAFTHKISILTGGPGTGKSTITKGIITLLNTRRADLSKAVLLAAPTGRAAKRLSEATGLEAKTIHRLLEFKPGADNRSGFVRDQHNPLDTDLIIIDETSMVDILLMNHLLAAVDQGSHLLLVGDVDQLPSVGAGNVLRDLITSDAIPVTRLDTIFRQAAQSDIIVNAHRINAGEQPRYGQAGDFFLFKEEDALAAANRVIEVVTQRVPQKFGFDPARDIQVLCPMHRGECGVARLNERLQEALNPPNANKNEYRHGARVFREGDRVMQTRNDYDRLVFNGDMGTILAIDLEESQSIIEFDGRPVTTEFSQLDEVTHAYAVSIHKSQGSEFPVVVLPILTQHFMMLQRNLLYTGVTRARKLAVLVGSPKAIAIAIKNDRITDRNTRLAARVRQQTER